MAFHQFNTPIDNIEDIVLQYQTHTLSGDTAQQVLGGMANKYYKIYGLLIATTALEQEIKVYGDPTNWIAGLVTNYALTVFHDFSRLPLIIPIEDNPIWIKATSGSPKVNVGIWYDVVDP